MASYTPRPAEELAAASSGQGCAAQEATIDSAIKTEPVENETTPQTTTNPVNSSVPIKRESEVSESTAESPTKSRRLNTTQPTPPVASNQSNTTTLTTAGRRPQSPISVPDDSDDDYLGGLSDEALAAAETQLVPFIKPATPPPKAVRVPLSSRECLRIRADPLVPSDDRTLGAQVNKLKVKISARPGDMEHGACKSLVSLLEYRNSAVAVSESPEQSFGFYEYVIRPTSIEDQRELIRRFELCDIEYEIGAACTGLSRELLTDLKLDYSSRKTLEALILHNEVGYNTVD